MLSEYVVKEINSLDKLSQLEIAFDKIDFSSFYGVDTATPLSELREIKIYYSSAKAFFSKKFIEDLFSLDTSGFYDKLIFLMPDEGRSILRTIHESYDGLSSYEKNVVVEMVTHTFNSFFLHNKTGAFEEISPSPYFIANQLDASTVLGVSSFRTGNYRSNNIKAVLAPTLGSAEELGINAYKGNRIGEYLRYYVSDETNAIMIQETPNSYSQIPQRADWDITGLGFDRDPTNFQVFEVDDYEIDTNLIPIGTEQETQEFGASFISKEDYAKDIILNSKYGNSAYHY